MWLRGWCYEEPCVTPGLLPSSVLCPSRCCELWGGCCGVPAASAILAKASHLSLRHHLAIPRARGCLSLCSCWRSSITSVNVTTGAANESSVPRATLGEEPVWCLWVVSAGFSCRGDTGGMCGPWEEHPPWHSWASWDWHGDGQQHLPGVWREIH